MTTTRRIDKDEAAAFFDAFTRRWLKPSHGLPVTLEIVSLELGDQIENDDAELLGVTFDARGDALDLWLDATDHIVLHPREIWVVVEDDGFLSAIEAVRGDGTKDLLSIRRDAPLAPRDEAPYERHA